MSTRPRDDNRELPLVRLLRRKSLTTQRAAAIIGIYTFGVTVIGGILIRFVDRQDFDGVGDGLWWAVQTVTTVGYGDITPSNTGGKLIAAVVMVSGIAFLTVVTAAVTAALVEAARRNGPLRPDADEAEPSARELAERLDRIEAQLARLADRADHS